MDNMQSLILISIVNIIITGLIGGIVIYRIQRKIDSSFSRQMEEFKASLQLSNYERQTKFAQLHAKRVEVLESLYQKFSGSMQTLLDWIMEIYRDYVNELEPGPDSYKKYHTDITEGLRDFYEYYSVNRLFLTDNLLKEISEIYEVARTARNTAWDFSLSQKQQPVAFQDSRSGRILGKVIDITDIDLDKPETVIKLQFIPDILTNRLEKLYKSVAEAN
jgi:hypothetical protein